MDQQLCRGECTLRARPSHSSSCVHFVGFRDDRYLSAVRVWGRPDFIHRWWDKRARREIDFEADTIIFAEGDWRQSPKAYNAPDLDED